MIFNQSLNNSNINLSVNTFGREWYVKRFMHIFYGVLASIAILGNGIVCIVILTRKKGKMMKSSLNLLILSMAIMDTMTGILMFVVPSFVIPVADYVYPKNQIAGSMFCRIIASQYAIFYFGFGSVFTITAIAIERWIAIAKPYIYRHFVTVKRTKLFVACLWIVNIGIPLDIIFQIDFIKNQQPPCKWNSFVRKPPGVYLFVMLEIIRLYLPVVIILSCYIDITRRVINTSPTILVAQAKSASSNVSHSQPARRATNTVNARRKVTIMVAASALAFIICWLPNEMYFTLYALNIISYNINIIRTTKTLIVTSSCLSPFIYAATNDDYRKGIISLINYCKSPSTLLPSKSYLGNVITPVESKITTTY